MRQEVHEQTSLQELGERYPEVHEWLDEYHPILGGRHREKRHHVEGILECADLMVSQYNGNWKRYVKAAAFHVAEDIDGKIPKRGDYNR